MKDSAIECITPKGESRTMMLVHNVDRRLGKTIGTGNAGMLDELYGDSEIASFKWNA